LTSFEREVLLAAQALVDHCAVICRPARWGPKDKSSAGTEQDGSKS